jgi:hypothetical protein
VQHHGFGAVREGFAHFVFFQLFTGNMSQ